MYVLRLPRRYGAFGTPKAARRLKPAIFDESKSAFTDWDLRKVVERHGDVVERYGIRSDTEMRKTVDEINTVIKRHDEENTVIKRHDEENPVIERHDEESFVVERHDEVEAHSEDCNQLIEVQMADTVVMTAQQHPLFRTGTGI
ncbi:hypothetical protein BDZ91DRAFT_799447 [Kalaharituber pfeilii]|nr:hypothetical protein BDZ91DRAFT_799447 [Kalaharituber pfeilii]